MNKIRRQLTLFVEPRDAETIEQVRQIFNPIQFGLIKCHVTLCREDEIENLEQVIGNLSSLKLIEIPIEFAKITRFEHGKGLLLPAKPNHSEFDNLRKQILSGVIDNPRVQEPHITLMHPRNSTCTDETFIEIEKIAFPAKLSFKKINLIEQKEGGQWAILNEFLL